MHPPQRRRLNFYTRKARRCFKLPKVITLSNKKNHLYFSFKLRCRRESYGTHYKDKLSKENRLFYKKIYNLLYRWWRCADIIDGFDTVFLEQLIKHSEL